MTQSTKGSVASDAERRAREAGQHVELQMPAQVALWKALAGHSEQRVCRMVSESLAAWTQYSARMIGGTWERWRAGMTYSFAATALLRALAHLPNRHTDLVAGVIDLAKRRAVGNHVFAVPEMVEALSLSPQYATEAESLVTEERGRLGAPGVSGEDAVKGLLKLAEACLRLDPELSPDVFEDARRAARLLTGRLQDETQHLAVAATAGATSLADRTDVGRRMASALRRLHDTA